MCSAILLYTRHMEMISVNNNNISGNLYQLSLKCLRFTSRYPRNNPLRPTVAAQIWCAFFSCLSSPIGLTYAQQFYNHGRWSSNTGNVMSQNVPHSRSHVMEPSRAPMPSIEQQQHYSSFNASTPLGNQSIHSQHNMSHIRPIGGVGAVATVGPCKP